MLFTSRFVKRSVVVALLVSSGVAQQSGSKIESDIGKSSIQGSGYKANIDLGLLSTQEIEAEISQCQIIQSLVAHKAANEPQESSFLQDSFKFFFPFTNPAFNALMATLYISGPPTILLTLFPSDIDPSNLNIMVAFAVGGLLGDTLFHLLPEIFLGEVAEGDVRAVLVEPNKNLLLGVAIMVGFLTFVAMDKGLRIATGGAGHSHDHGVEQSKSQAVADLASSTASSISSDNSGLRQRKQDPKNVEPVTLEDTKPPVKLSAYLNLIADFSHNITDGLAMASSFYASPTVGATTALAIVLHECPHQVGDLSLLIQSGVSKKAAIGLQFVTALGALLGTVIGIAIQEFGGNSENMAHAAASGNTGLFGTSLQWGDMLLPFSAGTFLYVATVGAVPEMLETGPNKWKELRGTILQFLAVAAGAGIMLAVSWS